MDRRAAERTERDIARLCHSGLDSRRLREAVVESLRRAIPIHSFWCATVDPSTLLFTGSVVDRIPEHATPAFLSNEFLHDDVNKFVSLARGPIVNSLREATEGELARSARYSDILVPLGLGDELRAVFTLDDACWGALCLHRDGRDPMFTPDEIGVVRRVVPHVAEGLRMALLHDEVSDAVGRDAPGLLVVADDFSVVATTPAADEWLAELADWPRRSEVPQAVRAVAARLREIERPDAAATGLVPRVRIRARGGRWLVLHAARLSNPLSAGGTIAIVIEPARPLDVAPLVLQAYALTEREARVAQLVLQGYSTADISARLRISAFTVQDHLKAIFDKTGVNSRRALVAHIFAQQYKPRMHPRP